MPPLAAAVPELTATAVGLVHASASFDQVFREFAPYVLRVLPRMGVATSDLDDVAQEVFLAVHRGLATFEGRSSVKTWLYGICIRTCSNYRGRAHRRREQLVEQPSDALELSTPEQSLAQRQALSALDAALAELPSVQRAVFVLHEVEALRVNEIAEVLDCSKFTVYARLYAARRSVKSRMGEYGDDGHD